MIYAYDEPIQLPVVDLYDSGMMGAYLTAAKDQYDNALKEQKEFYDKYGDFYSPITADVDRWYNLIGGVSDLTQRIYDEGGDPLRNPIDRARILRAANSIPRQELAKMKQSAAVAEKYLENRARLEAAGKWNPQFEAMILGNQGLPDLEHWDTSKNGIWNRMSPAEFSDLNTYTSHIFDDLKPSTIGKTKDGKWIIEGVSEGAMRDAMTSHLGGIVGSDLGQWYYRQAKNELIAEGNANPSDADIMKRLQDNIITANKERMYQIRKVNEYEKQRIDNAAALQRTRISASGSRGGGSNGSASYRPWDHAVWGGITKGSGVTPQQAVGPDGARAIGSGFKQKLASVMGALITDNSGTSGKDLFELGMAQFSTSDPTNFAVRGGFDTKPTGSDGYKLRSSDFGMIYTDYELMQNIYGASAAAPYVMGKYSTALASGYLQNKNKFESNSGAAYQYIIPRNDNERSLLTIPLEDGTVHQFRSIELSTGSGRGSSRMWYDYGTIGYIDDNDIFYENPGIAGQQAQTNAQITHAYGGVSHPNASVQTSGYGTEGNYGNQ